MSMNPVEIAREAAVRSAEVHCASCFDGTVDQLRTAAITSPEAVISLLGLGDYIDGLINNAIYEAEAGEDL